MSFTAQLSDDQIKRINLEGNQNFGLELPDLCGTLEASVLQHRTPTSRQSATNPLRIIRPRRDTHKRHVNTVLKFMGSNETSAMLPHAGLLRDETLILRWLFGYQESVSLPSGVQQPQFPSKDPDSVRFLSIDIDSLQEDDGVIQNLHVGISVLDFESLKTPVATGSTAGLATKKQPIESHHYIIGNPKFARRKANKFLFGNPETIPLSGLKDQLQSFTSNRGIILIFHGGHRELWALKALDIHLTPLYTIDTVKAAQYPLQLSHRCSLEKLLSQLEIPFAALHNAGNDAHFVLRAFLMLAVRDAQRELALAPDALPGKLLNSRATAQAPWPSTKAGVEAVSQRTAAPG